MANSSPSIVTLIGWKFSWLAAVLALLGSVRIVAAGEPAEAALLPGPATIEVDPGRIWLEVPAGYVYLADAAAIKRAEEKVGRSYTSDHVALIAPADLQTEFRVIRSTDPIDPKDWDGAPGPAWKQTIFDSIKVAVEGNATSATQASTGEKVIGWYAEPFYAAGLPRRIRVPVLIQGASGPPIVMTVGVVADADRQIYLLSSEPTELQAAAWEHMDRLQTGVKFHAPIYVPRQPDPTARQPDTAAPKGTDPWDQFGKSVTAAPLAKLVFMGIAAVFTALLSTAKQIGSFCRGLFGRPQQGELLEPADARPESPSPPPPPITGDFAD